MKFIHGSRAISYNPAPKDEIFFLMKDPDFDNFKSDMNP